MGDARRVRDGAADLGVAPGAGEQRGGDLEGCAPERDIEQPAHVALGGRAEPRAAAAIHGALERDVLLITCGAHDQVVRFIPPLNIGEEDLRIGIRAFVQAAQASAVGTPA